MVTMFPILHEQIPKETNGDKMLKANMVMDFEPHIYLYEGDETVDPAYWNVSARIEDVVLITSSGSEVLSSNLPIELMEIEDLMK